MATIYLGVLLVQLVVNAVTTQPSFHIYFERSGGFAGMTSSIEIDSDSLSTDEAEKLARLIDDSDFFEIGSEDVEKGNLPDQFQYKLTIEKNGREQTLELTDSSIPDSLRPLIQYLSRETWSKKN